MTWAFSGLLRADELGRVATEAMAQAFLKVQSRTKYLRITGSSSIRGYDVEAKQFSRDLGGARFVQTVDLTNAGRFRVDFSSVVTPWAEGDAPFFERQRTIAYQGNFFVDCIYKQGPPGSLYPINRVTVFGKAPGLFGALHSYLPDDALGGLVKVFGQTSIPDLLKDPLFKTGKGIQTVVSDVRREKHGDLDIVRIVVKDHPQKPCSMETLTLVPSQGWRVLGRTREWGLCRQAAAQRKWDYATQNVTEVAPGIWVPTRIELTRFEGGTPEEQVTIDLAEIAAGAEEIPEIYSVLIPPGSSVTDERSGMTFVAGVRPKKRRRK